MTSSTSTTARTVVGNESEGVSGVGIWDVPHLKKKSKKKQMVLVLVPMKLRKIIMITYSRSPARSPNKNSTNS